MQLTLIYTESNFLISKKQYLSWREIQDEYPDYKTSLGPWSVDEVIEYLAEEYSTLNPSALEQVNNFLADAVLFKVITFA
jgi:hypothetical protein